ncbi:MAG: MBL fold metallo-hydrolase [Spirochaetales bacterium]|nr:MBL fold metallo-hydrolase [Spirochaetales bacterium]
MKLHFHFSVAGFSNTYILGPDEGGDAIIIDPGTLNVALLNIIESNNYYIKNVLLTHAHESHSSGLKTLRKIYDFTVYSGNKQVLDFKSAEVVDGESLDFSGIGVRAIGVQGHSLDSLVYITGSCMFTGDAFGAGVIGTTPNSYARELLITSIKTKILTLERNYLIFPGHGSPSTLEAERITNPALAEK